MTPVIAIEVLERAPDDVVVLAQLCALSIDNTMRLTAHSLDDVLILLLSCSSQYYCRVDVTYIHVTRTSIGGRVVPFGGISGYL